MCRVSLLKRLHSKQINKLADALQPVHFKAGDVIITQGENGDVFYLVKQGTVVVSQLIEEEALMTPVHMRGSSINESPRADDSKDDHSEELVIMDLGEGEHFGERALLTSERRAATVKAKTDVVLMALDRDSFEEILGPLEVRHGCLTPARGIVWRSRNAAAVLCVCVCVCVAVCVWLCVWLCGTAQDLMEVTHSQRRLAAARVHLEREESIKNLTAAHEAAQKRGTPGAEHSSSAKPPALSPTEESKSEPREATAITPTTATGVSFGKRKLREDCVLANLRPVAVLGEGAFGLVQLVEHRVGTCYAMSCLARVCIWL